MKILFVCEFNACRSQIAEGLARSLLPGHYRVESAGLHSGEVNSVTVEVMEEIGIDISSHHSKRLAEVAGRAFDLVVVLAEPAAEETAKSIRSGRTVHWFYPDPAKNEDRETVKKKLREFRDAVKFRMNELVGGEA